MCMPEKLKFFYLYRKGILYMTDKHYHLHIIKAFDAGPRNLVNPLIKDWIATHMFRPVITQFN